MIKKHVAISSEIVCTLLMILSFTCLWALLLPSRGIGEIIVTLLLIGTLLLRWRLHLEAEYMIFDNLLLIVAVLCNPSFALFLYFHIFYLAYQAKYVHTIPALLLGMYYLGTLAWLPVIAMILGSVLSIWKKEQHKLQQSCDELRLKVYKLEQNETNLLSDYRDTQRLSALTERQRIAENLHDNLGHELTAAHLSLKATGTLLRQHAIDQAITTQQKAELRLDKALEQLKEAVMHLEPDTTTDIMTVRRLFDEFSYPVSFDCKGDLNRVPPYIFQLVLVSIKEALTNIQKHSIPTRILASLIVTESIVRLELSNDGILQATETMHQGGLRYMRKRIEAVKGSLSTKKNDVFTLIITLPYSSGERL
ncbi:MAG: histidine kinase [Sphaerochaetaceae bacterium]|nr:histidine kinase [Sphaerochaetaceae bacterium]NLO61647.1 hypothetical protein [Spirochaetales bacterium]MDD2405872.1 histidine kinase [Sphaerochaetaceae bacterium]MDD3670746.1 histidine kinase [Sphaerochaetaceae bacterium]MDD4258739.1 histidine kinase [Sphaerochaetaceae bacterium]